MEMIVKSFSVVAELVVELLLLLVAMAAGAFYILAATGARNIPTSWVLLGILGGGLFVLAIARVVVGRVAPAAKRLIGM